MKYLLILAAAAFAFFSISCDDDDTTLNGCNGTSKKVKKITFAYFEDLDIPSHINYEYDAQNRISKVLHEYKGWGVPGAGQNIYDVIHDNFIYDNNKILSIDFFNTLDSSSGKINYVYNGDQITISNESDNPETILYIINIDYTNQKLNSITSKESFDAGESFAELYHADVDYLDDNTLRLNQRWDGEESFVRIAGVDNSYSNPFNIFNTYDYYLMSHVNMFTFGGIDGIVSYDWVSPIRVSEAKDENYLYDVDADNCITNIAISISNAQPPLQLCEIEYYPN